MHRDRHYITASFAALAFALTGVHAGTAAAKYQHAATACAPSDGLHSICGLKASEDMVPIAASRRLIASGMNVGAPAHLYVVDTVRKLARSAYPGKSAGEPPPPPSTMGCSGPPDVQRMSFDGLALRQGTGGEHTLYAANHGDRMAIEIFSVDARGARPQLRWIDCAVLPAGTWPNAVAVLPGTGFLVISCYDPSDAHAWSSMARGEVTGRILQWRTGRGFTDLPDSATSGGNGLETSADGATVDASAWSAHQPVVLLLRNGARREIPLGFMPDNIHRLADGSLLVGGERTADKYASLADRGAHPAASAAEAAARAEFVLCSLNTAATVEQAVFGPGGVAESAHADKVLVDMSSIDPAQTRVLAERLQRHRGMGWVMRLFPAAHPPRFGAP